MTSSMVRQKFLHLLIPLILLSVGACRSETPLGPTSFSHIIENASCTFLVWPEGLRLMLWVDIIDNSRMDSTSGTGDSLFRQTGSVVAADGRRVDWKVETANGQTAAFSLDTQRPDLAQGALFLVTTAGGSTQIQQLPYDLAALPVATDSCQAVVENSPEVSTFIQEANNTQAR